MTSPSCSRAVWTLCLLVAGVGSGEAQTGLHQDFICISGASRRVISVFNLDPANGQQSHGGCRVDYTKDGETRTVYSSRSGRAFCAEKAALLVTTLAKGNYSCRAETMEKPEDPDVPEARPDH